MSIRVCETVRMTKPAEHDGRNLNLKERDRGVPCGRARPRNILLRFALILAVFARGVFECFRPCRLPHAVRKARYGTG